jgi:hypothetical protein
MAGIFSILSRGTTAHHPEKIPSPTPLLPSSVSETQRAAISATAQTISPALARAVAAVGQQEDGRLTDLSGLDEQAAPFIDQARALIATVPRRVAPGLPMRLPSGVVMKMGPDKKTVVPEAQTSPAVRDTNARIVDGQLIPRRLDHAGRVPIPMLGDLQKDLVEPDAWIAIPYDPALVAGKPLNINNRSGGLYAVSLDADDFSTVRLNGGLVVPGRFYQMENTTIISGDIPVSVTIRPIEVLHGVYDQPIRLPQANG